MFPFESCAMQTFASASKHAVLAFGKHKSAGCNVPPISRDVPLSIALPLEEVDLNEPAKDSHRPGSRTVFERGDCYLGRIAILRELALHPAHREPHCEPAGEPTEPPT
jgi:hypothetical protein